ncbi:MAG: ATP phosphoribosyltransferase regulatory subunit [Saccharofermentanales bacterium]|jgi:ATP phosphoribosyltransferase regulatory subunit HisZ
MSNQELLNRISLGYQYTKLMADQGYKLIDLNMIEPFRIEDKKFQPSSIVFERDERMYAIRSDWTRSLLNFNEAYFLADRRFCYYGPVIRNYRSFYQAGVELYQPGTDEIVSSIKLHLDFIQEQAEQQNRVLRSLVANNDYLIDLYLEKYSLDNEIRFLIYDKNLSELKEKLGVTHPLCKILSTRVSQQFDLIQQEFSDNISMKLINKIKKIAEQHQIKFVLDLSFRSPQGYYNGLYFQVFLNFDKPLLSGGEYNESAFGIALNLEDGGLV